MEKPAQTPFTLALRIASSGVLPVQLSVASSETAMKFRWSEWLTAAALVLTFSAFAAAEASEQTVVEVEAR